MKVVCHTPRDPGEYLIIASGTEMTVLEDALYRRAIIFDDQEDSRMTPHREKLVKMLAAVRKPFVARSED